MFSRIFIERPRFAMVISLVLTLAGDAFEDCIRVEGVHLVLQILRHEHHDGQ